MDSSLIIEQQFSFLTENQKNQFNALGELYAHWNCKINVISRKDIDHLYLRHVLHSLGIAKVCKFQKKHKVLDIGTGGGFPGIPLAIFFPETHFDLVDSIGKKIKVVREITQTLGLKNIDSHISRAEELNFKVHFIVSRAVTRIDRFLGWTANRYLHQNIGDLPNGLFYLKGGDLKQELSTIKKGHKVYSLSDYFSDHFFETKKVIFINAN